MPAFEWKTIQILPNKWNVIFKGNYSRARRASLLELLLKKDSDAKEPLFKKYICAYHLPHVIIKIIDKLMQEIKAKYLPEYDMSNVLKWIKNGINGCSLTIFFPICPDYSVENTSSLSRPYRHTFKILGSNNGQIAQRLLNSLPIIYETLEKLGIQVSLIGGIADFEGFSMSNLTKVNLSEEEFLNRVELSKLAFIKECRVEASVLSISKLCGGKANWIKLVNSYKTRFLNKDYGLSKITQKKLLIIAKNRRSLYSRWHGTRKTLLDYVPLVLDQGADYAGIGSIITNSTNNCLILGADNEIMRYFYCIESIIPTIYLNRFYS